MSITWLVITVKTECGEVYGIAPICPMAKCTNWDY